MIDWRDDQLIAERNAAQAEAKLWLKRTLSMQAERDQALADLAQWQKAYEELLQDARRMERDANAYRFDYEQAEAAVRFQRAA